MMNKRVCVSLVAGFMLVSGNVVAGDFQSKCNAVGEAGNLPDGMTAEQITETCSCLVGKIAEDGSIEAELMAGLDIADYDARLASLGPAASAAVEACGG